jgi:hypothetical protein
MRNKIKLVIISLIMITSPHMVRARTNFSLSAGYDINKYKKSITTTFGSYLCREEGEYFLSILGKENLQVNWLYDIDICMPKGKNTDTLSSDDFIGFYNILNSVIIEGYIHSVPITMTVYWEAFKKFRYGFGANINMNCMQKFDITNKPLSKNTVYKNMTFIRKILKTHLNDANIEKFRSNIAENLPEEYFWQIETIYGELDDVLDKNEKEKLKEIMDEYSKNSKDRSTKIEGYLNEYIPLKKINYTIDPFILLGFKFIENTTISALIDITISPLIITCNSLSNFYIITLLGPPQMVGAYSLGFTLEKHISEYYRCFFRLAYKTYDHLEMPKDVVPIYHTENWGLGFQFGISFENPEMERCIVDKCAIQVKHRHNNRSYRGSDIFTGEDLMGKKLFKK